ncbi:hypothetical protein LJB89_04340 [Tyzzerella sp. OttesenSCG-928-J15]|nr:hypothetical protein [Tyzzerella sp. OttesenSCG-928-J15]
MPIMPGSKLSETNHNHSDDHFNIIHPDTDWHACVEHAEKTGIGSVAYELVEIE